MPDALALVSFRIFPTLMGGQKGVALFYKYLNKQMKVLLATSKDNELRDNSLRILYPNKKIVLNLFKISKLTSVIEEHGIAIVIAEHSYTGWLAYLLKKTTKKPFIIHSHNIESIRFRKMRRWWWKLYELYEGWIHRKADYNFFISAEDRLTAIEKFGLEKSKCSVVTYGVEEIKSVVSKSEAKNTIGFDDSVSILLFNGTLDYKPNYDAAHLLIDELDALFQKRLINYKIIITGNRAPDELVEEFASRPNVIYKGFVPDVNIYYQAADLFLNPVSNPSGVKTKVIEALANNCKVISTFSGATGVNKELAKGNLITIADNDLHSFANEVKEQLYSSTNYVSEEFYNYYNWENIAREAAKYIEELILSNE